MSNEDADYLETCPKCSSKMHLTRLYGGMRFWKCPACQHEATLLESHMLFGKETEADLFVMWKSGKASRDELEALRVFWPPFRDVPIDALEQRYRDAATAELGRVRAGDIDWGLAQKLGLWVDIES